MTVVAVIACDISKYQPVADDSYPHRWLIFRCCDGGYRDPHCDANAQWATKAVAEGRLDGWTAYVVYRPGQNAMVLANAATLSSDGHVMVDVESWGGAIGGDHSADINDLVHRLSVWYPGRVWAYGNRSDLASIYPNRGPLPVVVAAYGGTKPDLPNMIGWQYTDGQHTLPGLPNATPPFGPCDHNILYLPAPESADSSSGVEVGAQGTQQLVEDGMYEILQNDTSGALRAAGPGYWRALEGGTKAETAANLANARTGPLCANGGKVRRVSDLGMSWWKNFYLNVKG